VSLPTQRVLDIDLDVPADFGNWLAGLTDGEGSFLISRHPRCRSISCRFQLLLRVDDKPLVEEIKQRLGNIGSIILRKDKRENHSPGARLQVDSCADVVHVLIPLFDRYRLRSKKRRDYELWKQAALLIASDQHLTPEGRAEVLRLKAEMEAGRKYNGANGAMA